MSLAHLTNLQVPSAKLQFAALKMEADKADQLRAQWEAIESKNTGKLKLLVDKVEKFKKRTESRVFKSRLAVSRVIGSDYGQMGLFVGSIVATALVVGLSRTQNVNDFVVAGVALATMSGSIGVLLDGFSLGRTARQYSKNNQINSRNEVFNSIKKQTSSNKELNTCMEQLYTLGTDDKIPAPFWSQCGKLLEEITKAHTKYTLQQRQVKNLLEEISERNPQADQSIENLKSFAARHDVFVAVKSAQEQDVQVQQPISKNQSIKI